MVVVVGIQFYRYRRISGPVERQQTKWVLYGLALPILMFVGFTVLLIAVPQASESNAWAVLVINEFEFLLPLCLPLSFGLAILRYRLWDIDTLINRTLVYGALTILLTAIFVGLVIGMKRSLVAIGRDNRVVIIISTLAIAALFQPIRSRVQIVIDRRFYRHKYDVAKTLEHFSATLSHEMDLDTLREQVLSLVAETMPPRLPCGFAPQSPPVHRPTQLAFMCTDTHETVALSLRASSSEIRKRQVRSAAYEPTDSAIRSNSSMKGAYVMNSLAQSTSTTGQPIPRSGRIAGGSAILSGIALVLLSEQMYLPSSFDLLFFLFTLVFLLGLIPAIRWMGQWLAAHDTGNGSRVAEFVGLAGVAVAIATAACGATALALACASTNAHYISAWGDWSLAC